VPRYYGSNIYTFTEGEVASFKFVKTLKDEQLSAYKVIEPALREKHGGSIVLPCGFGKTVLSLFIAAQIGVKTAILVDSGALAHQWVEEVSIFTNVIATVFKGNKRDTDSDIVIFMVQSLNSTEIHPEEAKKFGLVIADECDIFSANRFNKSIAQFPGKYRIGLTATEHRSDGLSNIFKWHLGETIFRKEEWDIEPVILKVNTGIHLKISDKTPKAIATNIQTNNTARNLLIHKIIVDCLASGKNVLVVSDRKNQLRELSRIVNTDSFMFIEDSLRDDIPVVPLIFTTYTKCKRGMSINKLDILIMASARSGSTEQVCGRIVRKDHGYSAFVVDLVDANRVCKDWWCMRKRHYLKKDWKVYEYDPKSRTKKKIN